MPASAVSFASSPFAGSQKRLLRAQRGGSSRQREGRSRATRVAVAAAANKEVWLLDYGAGNVRSVRNAIKYLGYNVRDVRPRVFFAQRARSQMSVKGRCVSSVRRTASGVGAVSQASAQTLAVCVLRLSTYSSVYCEKTVTVRKFAFF